MFQNIARNKIAMTKDKEKMVANSNRVSFLCSFKEQRGTTRPMFLTIKKNHEEAYQYRDGTQVAV